MGVGVVSNQIEAFKSGGGMVEGTEIGALSTGQNRKYSQSAFR
jgi:hypothetical protein